MSATIIHGECVETMRQMPDNSIDSVFTDPPYHLTTNDRYGKTTLDSQTDSNSARARAPAANDALARLSRGFMGKLWDGGDVAFRVETWREVLRVLKPGGHLMAFGGTRTYHRMTCAIEDAGFEIRDGFGWLYGSGFPKSHDVSKGIDAMLGATRPIVGKSSRHGGGVRGAGTSYELPPEKHDLTAPGSAEAAQWQGWGTAVKPAWEPLVLARKPLDGTVAANVLKWGTGGINIDASRIGTDGLTYHAAESSGGRFPANIAHDGSPDVLAVFPNDNARFFYCAKADKTDRAGSKHPTVKPLDLVRYYVTMITPPGGTVLDCFAGSGTTLQAASEAGFNAVGIEMTEEYFHDIRARLGMIPPRHYDLFGPLQPWDFL